MSIAQSVLHLAKPGEEIPDNGIDPMKPKRNAKKAQENGKAEGKGEAEAVYTHERAAKSSELHLDTRNYRKHNDRNKKLIRQSLEELGAGRSIVADREGEIVAGNGVFEQAQKLKIPVRVIETDGSELIAIKRTDLGTEDPRRKKLALADNATSDSSEWDYDVLSEDWDSETLTEWGIDMPEEEDDNSLSGGETDPDDIPEVEEQEEPCSVRGEVYQLGNHRLMCGDSTSAEDVEKLMQGEKADMVFTDPPYGMGLDTDYSSMKSGLAIANDKGLKGGKKYKQGKVDEFVPEIISTIFTCFDGVKEVFLWGGDYFSELLPDKNNGSWIVWDKRLDDSADKMYGSCFELCWSKQKHKRDIARIKWAGVFGTEKEFDHKRHHPTQKPTALVAWFFERYGKAGETVVDLFGGSGSTLIACEQLNRRCRMMELDPYYCDVIRRRWAEFVHGQGCDWQALTPAVAQETATR